MLTLFEQEYETGATAAWNYAATVEVGCNASNCPKESHNRQWLKRDTAKRNVLVATFLVDTIFSLKADTVRFWQLQRFADHQFDFNNHYALL